MAEDSLDVGLEDLRKRFPMWTLQRPVSGDAAFAFSRSHLLELHRQELSEELSGLFLPDAVSEELPYPIHELVLGPEIPAGDDIALYWSKDANMQSGIREFRSAVNIHWPFAAKLLRRVCTLVPADEDLRSRLRVPGPDRIMVWRERWALLRRLYAGEDIREQWQELQSKVLEEYDLQDLPVGKVRNIGHLLPDLDREQIQMLAEEAEQLGETLFADNQTEVSEDLRLRYPCFSRGELQAVVMRLHKARLAGRNALATRLGISLSQLSELTRKRR